MSDDEQQRLEDLEQKVAYLWSLTRCPCCDENARSAEEHDCPGDWEERGHRCYCCSACARDCADSV